MHMRVREVAGILQAPLIVGSDLRNLSATALATLSNKQASTSLAGQRLQTLSCSARHDLWAIPSIDPARHSGRHGLTWP
jgi:hypothetical protein